jgi:hypothetical protein
VEAETTMTGCRTRRESGLRAVALAGAIAAGLVGLSTSAGADIPSPGMTSVRNEVSLEWGPLEGRIARPVAANAGDTWDALATRETASAAWAPTIRALNGGGDAPRAGGETWVPPRALAFGAKNAFFAAFLDSARFSRGNDVSRTGFRALDPGRASHEVFGEVTLALVPVRDLEGAAAAAALPSRRASETIRERPSGVLVVELGHVIGSVASGAPLRRIVATWRCESLAGDAGVSFSRVSEERFDAQGAPIGGSGETPTAVSYGFIAGGTVILALLALLLVRRRAGTPS